MLGLGRVHLLDVRFHVYANRGGRELTQAGGGSPPLPPAGHPWSLIPCSAAQRSKRHANSARPAGASQRPAARPVTGDPALAGLPGLRVLRRDHRGRGHRRRLTETAYICEVCGCAWPLACVVEWEANPDGPRRPYPAPGRCAQHQGSPVPSRIASVAPAGRLVTLGRYLRVSRWLASYSWSRPRRRRGPGAVLVPWSRVPDRPVLVHLHPDRLQRVFWELRLIPARVTCRGCCGPADFGRGAVLGAVPARHLSDDFRDSAKEIARVRRPGGPRHRSRRWSSDRDRCAAPRPARPRHALRSRLAVTPPWPRPRCPPRSSPDLMTTRPLSRSRLRGQCRAGRYLVMTELPGPARCLACSRSRRSIRCTSACTSWVPRVRGLQRPAGDGHRR